MTEFEEFLEKINDLRQSYQLDPVRRNSRLTEAAAAHVRDMTEMEKLSHTGSDGSGFDSRIIQAGYRFRMAEENIAFSSGPSDAFSDWCNSPPHRKNMLNPVITDIGYAVKRGGNLDLGAEGIYASLSLASPAGSLPSEP